MTQPVHIHITIVPPAAPAAPVPITNQPQSMFPVLTTEQRNKKLDSMVWIIRRKYCSLQAVRFGTSVQHYKSLEKQLQVVTLIFATLTTGVTLGTVSLTGSMVKAFTCSVSGITTLIAGWQKIKNYPENIDKGMQLAEEWRKVANEINLRLNRMDNPGDLPEGTITEEDAVTRIGDLKVQNITYRFPNIADRTAVNKAMRLLDSCVASKLTNSCTDESIEALNIEVNDLLNPIGDDSLPPYYCCV